MDLRVTFTDSPAEVLKLANDFLLSQPVLHNLILSLLHFRVKQPAVGRYWVASRDGQAVGVVFQSPVTVPALLTPMAAEVVNALVDAIADQGFDLPGVSGDAATAALFAGRWSERRKRAAVPFQGMRLYELSELESPVDVSGALRLATPADRLLMIGWVRAYETEVQEPSAGDPERLVDRWMSAGQLWVWEDSDPVSMAVSRDAVAGVVRVSGVFTPPDRRRRSYAAACVSRLSESLQTAGFRCILYTDLGNPTSNSIYRRIGYRAVSEAIRYRFG